MQCITPCSETGKGRGAIKPRPTTDLPFRHHIHTEAQTQTDRLNMSSFSAIIHRVASNRHFNLFWVAVNPPITAISLTPNDKADLQDTTGAYIEACELAVSSLASCAHLEICKKTLNKTKEVPKYKRQSLYRVVW